MLAMHLMTSSGRSSVRDLLIPFELEGGGSLLEDSDIRMRAD